MSAADVDKAVSKYANTGGYNVLYDALRVAGFSPSKAVNELYKSDNKNGMSTQIMSDDSVNSLLAGKAVSGPNNDIPPLEQRNLNEYTNFVSALKVFASTKNYSEFDKIIDGFSDLDQNTQDVLMAKANDVVPDGSLKYVLECAQLGISSKDYYDLKATISDTQREMNKSSNTGTPLKLVAIQNAKLTDEQREALLDSDWMGISKTGHACLNVMRDYGMSIGEIGEFMNYAATVYGNMWGSGLTNVKAAAALEANTTLTDQQKAAVYEALKSQISSKYNDWGSYRYNTSTSRRYDNSELAYIHGPKFAGYLADYKAQHPEEFTDSDNDFDLLTDEEVEALRNAS
jgi:predicted DNA binding protein